MCSSLMELKSDRLFSSISWSCTSDRSFAIHTNGSWIHEKWFVIFFTGNLRQTTLQHKSADDGRKGEKSVSLASLTKTSRLENIPSYHLCGHARGQVFGSEHPHCQQGASHWNLGLAQTGSNYWASYKGS